MIEEVRYILLEIYYVDCGFKGLFIGFFDVGGFKRFGFVINFDLIILNECILD